MNKAPAFQFYPKDFLEGTATMSNAEAGAYIKLLCHQWLKDSITNEREILIRLCNGDEAGLDVALSKFKKQKNGTLKNIRLQNEKKNQIKFQKNKKKAGEKGANGRWHKSIKNNELNGTPIDLPIANGIAKNGSASATASSIIKSKQAVYEIMRAEDPDKKKFSDTYLEKEAQHFFEKYKGQEIGSPPALVRGWMKNIEPDIQPKKMVW